MTWPAPNGQACAARRAQPAHTVAEPARNLGEHIPEPAVDRDERPPVLQEGVRRWIGGDQSLFAFRERVFAAPIMDAQVFCCSLTIVSNIEAKICTGVSANSIPGASQDEAIDAAGAVRRVAASCSCVAGCGAQPC
jgi:hypothetical protein